MEDEAGGESAFPIGPPSSPTSLPLHQWTTPTMTLYFSYFRLEWSGPAIAGSGQTVGSSRAASVSGSTCPQLPSPNSNRSTNARNLKLWQYEKFVKDGGHPFLGKLDA